MRYREGRVVGIYGVWDIRATGELVKGNGKTTTMGYFQKIDCDEGYTLLSNYGLSGAEQTTTQEVYDILKDPSVCHVSAGLDEIQKDLNSLPGAGNPMLTKNMANVIGAQTRKRDIRLYWTTQRVMDVPRRFVTQTDYLFQPIRVHSNRSRCMQPDCARDHFIEVYSRDPEKINPIVTLDCEEVGKMFDTRRVLSDMIEAV